MYKFVKGSRLFMQGTRESADYDNIHDTFQPTYDDRNRGGYREQQPQRGSNGHRHHHHETSGSSSSGRRHHHHQQQHAEHADGGDEIRAVHTMRTMNVEGNTEWERSARTVRRGGIKTKSTRTVRKVTTVTRGEQSVTNESVMSYSSDNSQRYPAIAADKKSLKFRVVDEKVLIANTIASCRSSNS